MNPIGFDQVNTVFGKNQPEYQPLPAYATKDEVISCWQLTWREALKLVFTRRLWLRQLTFGSTLQPQCPEVDTPFEVVK